MRSLSEVAALDYDEVAGGNGRDRRANSPA
jgi:hypothetical protein